MNNKPVIALLLLLALFPGCRCSSCSGCIDSTAKLPVESELSTPERIHVVPSVKEKIGLRETDPGQSIAQPQQIEHGGRLFITGENIYYIKNGAIVWQSGPARKYQKLNTKYYVATEDYVFCTLVDGTVVWKTRIRNRGSCDIREGTLHVLTAHGETRLDLISGQRISW